MYATFSSSGFSDLSNVRFSKKLIFTCWSVLTDFCQYLHLPLNLFLLVFSLRKRVLKEVVTVANVLMGVRLVLKNEPSGFIILIALTLLMKIV